MVRTRNGKIGKFHHGSSTFKCDSCGVNTRRVGDAPVGTCEFCYELAGIYNMLQDGQFEELAKFESDVNQLTGQILARGGKLDSDADKLIKWFADRKKKIGEIKLQANICIITVMMDGTQQIGSGFKEADVEKHLAERIHNFFGQTQIREFVVIRSTLISSSVQHYDADGKPSGFAGVAA